MHVNLIFDYRIISGEESSFMTIEYNGYRPGSIKHVSVKNFMCHSNLVLNFGSGVNFVVGTNGSNNAIICRWQECNCCMYSSCVWW